MNIRTLISETFRFLTFRSLSAAAATEWRSFLAFGMACTWLAGVGRYWDNPRASAWQMLGLGSVIYVFVLALLLWLVALPMRPRHWSYRNVLLFVTLTSPLAFLYAIPVEKFMPLGEATTLNAWFLAVVALWRVALLFHFLWRVARLKIIAVIVTTLLPLAGIVLALSMLNLEHVVFELMGGIPSDQRSSHDTAYLIVFALSFYSIFATPFLLVAYGFCAWHAYLNRASTAENESRQDASISDKDPRP